FPLDGGRLIQALLWSRQGYANSMRTAVRAGFVGAILLFIFGVVTGQHMITLISIFGGFTCWYTNKQLEFTESFMGFEDDQYMINKFDEQAEEPKERKKAQREDKRREKEAKQQEDETIEVDRLLEKIAQEGMGSLTSREKKFLESHSQRKRQDG
ncbi:MAG: hypothetical protein O7G85_01605, partial [Planctomycetota bacterium]|nr:hypothetical protein [Planctomycetota bacterium]